MGKIPRPKEKKKALTERGWQWTPCCWGVAKWVTASPEVSKELRVQVEDFSRPAPGPHTRSQAVGMQISVASGSAQSRIIKQSRMTKCQGLCKSVPACSLGHSALHQTVAAPSQWGERSTAPSMPPASAAQGVHGWVLNKHFLFL